MRKPYGCCYRLVDRRDAQDAICDLNGKHNWWVELSHYYRGDGDRSDRDSGEFDSGNDYHCR